MNMPLSGSKFSFLMLIFIYSTITQAQVAHSNIGSSKKIAMIPAGSFTMGSNTGSDDEKPVHTVFIQSFFLDVLPVTNAEFAAFLNSQGLKNQRGESFYDDQDNDARIHLHHSKWQADDGYAMHPVNEVSWIGAHDYCNWLKKRLPT